MLDAQAHTLSHVRVRILVILGNESLSSLFYEIGMLVRVRLDTIYYCRHSLGL